ncbi:MAG: hypothetical protein AB7N24_22640 [Dehalococcoidia bacterium]
MIKVATHTLGAVAALVVSGGVLANPGFAVTPTGQALSSTCQSYALGLALAFKRDPNYKVETASQLRAIELAIREQIKKAAGAASVNHDHIRAGFESFTGGKYKLVFKDVDVASVGEEAGKRSGVAIASAVPQTFLLGAVIKDATLASATKISGDSYTAGHIFTILGKDGPPNSNQKLLILNSAVKVKNLTKNMCVDGVPDDPGPYTAELSWKVGSEITYKMFGGKVRLWLIEKS